MGYIEETLPDNEEIALKFKFNSTYEKLYLIASILLIFAAGIGLLFLLQYYIQFKKTEMAITNLRIIKKVGWISQKTEELALSKIEEVRLSRGILQRILGAGEITVSGTGSNEIKFSWIADPIQAQKTLNQLKNERSL